MLSSVQDAEDRGKNKMSSSCHGAYTPEDRGVEPRYGHDLERTLQETDSSPEREKPGDPGVYRVARDGLSEKKTGLQAV